MMHDQLYTRADVLRIIRKSSKTLTAWLKTNRFPPPAVAITREAQQWTPDQLRQAGYGAYVDAASPSSQSAKS